MKPIMPRSSLKALLLVSLVVAVGALVAACGIRDDPVCGWPPALPVCFRSAEEKAAFADRAQAASRANTICKIQVCLNDGDDSDRCRKAKNQQSAWIQYMGQIPSIRVDIECKAPLPL
jgi:hypothetical protein